MVLNFLLLFIKLHFKCGCLTINIKIEISTQLKKLKELNFIEINQAYTEYKKNSNIDRLKS